MYKKFLALPSHKQVKYLMMFFITTLTSVVTFLYRKVEITKIECEAKIQLIEKTYRTEIALKDDEIKRLNENHIKFIERHITEREEMKRNIDSLKFIKK